VKTEADKVNTDLLPSSRPQPGSTKNRIREEAKVVAAERSAAADEVPIAALVQSIRAQASPNGAVDAIAGERSLDSGGGAPSSSMRGNLAARSTISSLLGPRMGSGLTGLHELAVIRDLKRKKDAAEMAEAWLKRQALLLEGDEMDSAIDEEFDKADQAEEEARRISRPRIVWCNKKAGVMTMQPGTGQEAEIMCLCDECCADDADAMDAKDFCLHTGLKDKSRWKEAISVDQRRSEDDGESERDRGEWRALLQSISPPKAGELPKLGAWMQPMTTGVQAGSKAASSEGSKKPRSKKRRLMSDAPTADPGPKAIQQGFVDPEYQNLLETLNQTLSAANAAQLLMKPATNMQGSGGTS
jgi:hypothetical protein